LVHTGVISGTGLRGRVQRLRLCMGLSLILILVIQQTPGRRKLGITEFKEKWGWGEARAEAVLTWQMMWGGDGSS
jgi:hypothetical protein